MRRRNSIRRIWSAFWGLSVAEQKHLVTVALLVSGVFLLAAVTLTSSIASTREAEAIKKRKAIEDASAALVARAHEVLETEKAARRFCDSAIAGPEDRWTAYQTLASVCRFPAPTEALPEPCRRFASSLNEIGKANDLIRRLESRADSVVLPTIPPAPEYERPAYDGAFLISGKYRPEYGGQGMLLEQEGRYFVVEDGKPVNPLATWIRAYVESTNRTERIAIGRFGRDATIVRLSSLETYRDDRRIYEQSVVQGLAEFNEARASYLSHLTAMKELRDAGVHRRIELQSKRDEQLKSRAELIVAELSRLTEQGACGSERMLLGGKSSRVESRPVTADRADVSAIAETQKSRGTKSGGEAQSRRGQAIRSRLEAECEAIRRSDASKGVVVDCPSMVRKRLAEEGLDSQSFHQASSDDSDEAAKARVDDADLDRVLAEKTAAEIAANRRATQVQEFKKERERAIREERIPPSIPDSLRDKDGTPFPELEE
jgi:hypothetical protein